MLRQSEVQRVLGRRLVERLLRAGWIVPAQSDRGKILFAERDIHRALTRLQSAEADRLNGHARRVVPSAPKSKA
jgi:hypothetical protein